MPTLRVDQLINIGTEMLKAVGASDDEAIVVAEFLVRANLSGHDSHGIMRIPDYVRMIQRGEIKPGTEMEIVRETPSSAVVNGNRGFGQVVAKKCMELAVEKAKANTISSVVVFNLGHIGRLFDYSNIALEHDMIGITLRGRVVKGRSEGSFGVAPFGGREGLLATNPLCIAIPTGKENPFFIDMSTSVVAEGKVRIRLQKNEALPDGWIIDKEGRPSNNPADLYAGGSLLTIGGGVGYKGTGLSIVVAVLAGLLSPLAARGRINGVFMGDINIESFVPIDEFKDGMDNLIRYIKSSKPAKGFSEVLVPGELEVRTIKKRLEEGVDIPDETWEEIVKTAKELRLDVKKIIL